MGFIRAEGDWQALRERPGLMEVDLHFGRGEPGSFRNNMAEVGDIVRSSLREAQKNGVKFVMFRHGYSTSGPFQTTARSIVRAIMRSKESTPFVIKAKSIQHRSVFIAAIRTCSIRS